MWIAIILVALVVLVIGFLVSTYNRLIRLKNQIANGFAQIDVQLKRRHDLIPNLVEIAKRYMGHEATSLIEITKARNLAHQLSEHTSIDDGEQLAKLAQAENSLSKALAQFYATVENYPELKADSLMKQSMDEITNTENRIGFARQHYNDSVMFYNNEREVFPNNIVSSFFKFDRIEQLQFEDKSVIQNAPSVNFD